MAIKKLAVVPAKKPTANIKESLMYSTIGMQPRQGEFVPIALGMHEMGGNVFPLCDKLPLKGSKWEPLHSKPLTVPEIKERFADPRVNGIGLIPGRYSAMVAGRDFDKPGAYAKWAEANPKDAERFPTTRTGRGHHVYGRLPEERYWNVKGEGELIGKGNRYLVVAPSWHPSGRRYETIIPFPKRFRDLPLLPDSLTTPPHTPDNTQSQIQIRHSGHDSNTTKLCTGPLFTQEVLDAIAESLPRRAKERNHQRFYFAQLIKGIHPNLSIEQQTELIREWHRQALSYIDTKDFKTTLKDFLRGYADCRYPLLRGYITAFKRAREHPDPPIDHWAELGILAAMCKNLADGNGRFYLSCHSLADCFHMDHRKGLKMLKLLETPYGIIRRVKKGTYFNRAASRFELCLKTGVA